MTAGKIISKVIILNIKNNEDIITEIIETLLKFFASLSFLQHHAFSQGGCPSTMNGTTQYDSAQWL